jgi:hypothetical protein
MGAVLGHQGEARTAVANRESQPASTHTVGIGVTDHVAAEKAALDSWVLVIGVAEEKGCAEEAERNGPLDRPVAEVEVDNVVSVQGKLAVEEEGEDSSLLGPGEENRTVPEESSGEAAHIVVENCEEL